MSRVTDLSRRRERKDKRGRRVGYNWWREYNMQGWSSAHAAWEHLRESGQPVHTGARHVAGADGDTAYYQLSDREYQAIHPRPTLKEFLIHNAGMGIDLSRGQAS